MPRKKQTQNLSMNIEPSSNKNVVDDIEAEIDKILSNIQQNEDLETLDDIEEIRQLAIDKVFNSYMVYEKNIINKKMAEYELEEYRFIDIADLKKGDFVRYFNLTKFYDLKLVIGGTIMDLDYQGTGEILLFAPYGVKRIKPNIFFKKINTDDMIKMKLIQIANTV
jgi:hypothetical protein